MQNIVKLAVLVLCMILLLSTVVYCQKAKVTQPADSMMTPAPAPAPAPAPSSFPDPYSPSKRKKNDGWVYMFVNSEYRYSFKHKKRTDKGTIRVWIKQELLPYAFDEKERITKDHHYQSEYAKFSHTLTMYELDCRNDKIKSLSYIDYDDDGNVLSSVDQTDSNVKWRAVIPDSRGEEIFQFFCQ